MQKLLESEIKYLPGVGPVREKLLQKELKIFTFSDLLYYFPYKYVDRSKIYNISELNSNLQTIQIKGQFLKFEENITTNGKRRLIGHFADDSGVIEVLWFQNVKWIASSLHKDKQYILFGKPSLFANKINIIHPDIEDYDKWENKLSNKIAPIYRLTDKLRNNNFTSKSISVLVEKLISIVRNKIHETLPKRIIVENNLLALEETIINLHFPSNETIIPKAQYRIKFEELFYIQLELLRLKIIRKNKSIGFVFHRKNDNLVKECFFKNIPFKLTDAQTKVLQEIRKDFESGKQCNRLIQGDVGSGKTMVAILATLIAIDNGYQACIMAPTEILAQQHFSSILKVLKNLNVKVALLTGSTKKKERTLIHKELNNGEINLLIGTHALIENDVIFSNLGLVVIDEQHRFGVEQRAKLWKKNIHPPHVLVMTATPIPRTLAMTLYGDLDVSTIDELPPGRTAIITRHFKDNQRKNVYDFMKQQIKAGRQVYVVYPLIYESEAFDYKNLEEGVDLIKYNFPKPDYDISIVHGKLKPAEKEFEMQRFVKNETQIMVATTVIEVGVDVPNATIMVIESADRFGLSQLHQLRGRVGRSDKQSYCFLMTGNEMSNFSYQRINTMVRSTNGFEISEADLKLRGPGDMEGREQSGFITDLKMANLSTDGNLIQFVRDIAADILDDDSELEKPQNAILKNILKEQKNKLNFGVIS